MVADAPSRNNWVANFIIDMRVSVAILEIERTITTNQLDNFLCHHRDRSSDKAQDIILKDLINKQGNKGSSYP